MAAEPPAAPEVVHAVERLAGAEVVSQRSASGGYTHTPTWVAELAGGGTVFVKAAVDERTRAWLRAEHDVYSLISGEFMPNRLGWEDDRVTVLLLEDLSSAMWPPPWSSEAVGAVTEALRELHALKPPKGLRLAEDVDDFRGGWRIVADDPEPFLELGACTVQWLARSLPELDAASERARLDGDCVVHLDVRSDNLCIRDGRCVFVDWTHAGRGNPLLDLAWWLPSLAAEGGPAPDELAGEGMGELAALMSGYLACRATMPEPPNIPSPGVRSLQLAQLRVSLPWAARCLGLPQPRRQPG